MTWQWLRVRPGILALSGTPFQVRHDQPWKHRWQLYEYDRFIAGFRLQRLAKQAAERNAKLIEAGVIEDPR